MKRPRATLIVDGLFDGERIELRGALPGGNWPTDGTVEIVTVAKDKKEGRVVVDAQRFETLVRMWLAGGGGIAVRS